MRFKRCIKENKDFPEILITELFIISVVDIVTACFQLVAFLCIYICLQE